VFFVVNLCVLEKIDGADGCLRRTEVVFFHVANLGPAIRAGIDLGVEVEIADTDRRLDIPMFPEHPLIAVADAYTRAPTLVAFVFRAEEFDIGDIIY